MSCSLQAPAVDFDEQRIDAIFAPLDQRRLPGAAVGIAIGGRPVYRKGFGLASMQLPVALSASIRMRIGSTSKHFASLAYLLLCEEGLAGLDDEAGRHLPQLHPVNRRVTMRQLMGHVGGLRDVFDISWQFSGTDKFVSSEELLAMYQDIEDVNAPPASHWIYSNGGYLMLSIAIERITGQPFEEVLRERVFEPIGMRDTLVRRWARGFVPNSASLHMKETNGEWGGSPFFGTAFLGEGGIVSTVDDMLRWMSHMDAPQVGSADTWQVLKTPLRLASGVATGYGLGLFQGEYRGVGTLHHPGGGMGGTAQMLKVPSAGLDVIVMANRDDVSPMELVDRILDACLPGLDPVRSPPGDAVASGLFLSPNSSRVIQLYGRDGRQFAAVDGMEMPLAGDGQRKLLPTGLFAYARQSIALRGNAAEPDSIEFNDYGCVEDFVRQAAPGDADSNAIAGRYRSASTGTTMTIAAAAGGATLVTAGRFGSVTYRLECLAPKIWRALPTHTTLGGVLVFDTDREEFRFSCHRTWALPFRRVS